MGMTVDLHKVELSCGGVKKRKGSGRRSEERGAARRG